MSYAMKIKYKNVFQMASLLLNSFVLERAFWGACNNSLKKKENDFFIQQN